MRKSVEVIFNLLFWTVIIYLDYYWIDKNSNGFMGNADRIWFAKIYISRHSYYWIIVFFTLIGPIINFYLFYFLLVPRLLFRKKLFLFIIFALISSLIIGNSFRLTMGGANEITRILVFTIMALVCGIIGGSIKGIFLWQNSVTERRTIEKKHLESQTALLMLKAQLNPHFLFNSLNNIDVLIEENPKKASDYLTKFSDILRYVLYETKEEESELARELEQINNYIELQKIRTDNPDFVKFQITGELKVQKIAPMLFLPFIENAFKHSKNKNLENSIEIEFVLSQSLIKMICRNYYEASQLEVIKSEGLGIETIKQRLNLLYPEKHILNIEKTEHWFNVTLIIDI